MRFSPRFRWPRRSRAAPSAAAQTQQQQNVMTHIGRTVALNNKCPALKPNNLIIGMVTRQHGIAMNRAPYSDIIVAKGADYAREIAALDQQAAAISGEALWPARREGAEFPALKPRNNYPDKNVALLRPGYYLAPIEQDGSQRCKC
jgi:hypothetical protein